MMPNSFTGKITLWGGSTLTGLMFLVAPFSAGAGTLEDLQNQLASLLKQIAQIQTQMQTFAASSTSSSDISPGQYRVCAVLNRNLGVGARGDDVSSLQEFLQTQGYLSLSPTGYYGPITASAVAKWQTSEGVSAIGAFGPLSRARLKIRCEKPLICPMYFQAPYVCPDGSQSQPDPKDSCHNRQYCPGTTSCKPINYMPIACSDGSQPQATHNESGCITGYECPVANFVPSSSCKAWNDGCNICSRQTPTSNPMCTQRACFAAGKGYCTTYFDPSTSSGQAPVISGISGPTTLAVGESGTWTINASDPENGTLSYSITWGDEPWSSPVTALSAAVYTQMTTFTHAYANAGVYTVKVIVQDSNGQSAQTTTTVQVGSNVACTMEYMPVCGQPPEPACRHSVPACMVATPGPQTYSNRCQMNAAGATYLYDGACESQPTSTCPSGQYACGCATGHYCLQMGAMCISPTSACPAGAW